MRYPCGCVNEVHSPSGILHNVSKCDKHKRQQRDPVTLDESYYTELGMLQDGWLADPGLHVAQLTEALGQFPEAWGRELALEIGCGTSPYVEAIRTTGWRYTGLDPSRWAVEWTTEPWGCNGVVSSWEAYDPPNPFGLILCAHALEHMRLAPVAVHKMAEALEPGGELWVVVPDDSDPLNADHVWFFTQKSLLLTLASAGLAVEALATRKYIERENFIYAKARKEP